MPAVEYSRALMPSEKPQQDLFQTVFHFYPVEFVRLDQVVYHGSSVSTMIAAEEKPVLFSQTDEPEGSFGSVIICLSHLNTTPAGGV